MGQVTTVEDFVWESFKLIITEEYDVVNLFSNIV